MIVTTQSFGGFSRNGLLDQKEQICAVNMSGLVVGCIV